MLVHTFNTTKYGMLRSILLVLSIVSLASGQCGVGEVYTSCGTSCPSTCDNYLMTDRVCTADCVSGCFCEAGRVRSPEGTCVPTSECASYQCGANQQYECGTECPDTCDNYDEDRSCIESCRLGCFCRQSYVLVSNTSSECVLTSQCPGRVGCRADEHYNRCGTACPATCEGAIGCTLQCVPGCFCNDGYVMNGSECLEVSACFNIFGNGAGTDRPAFLLTLFALLVAILNLF